MGTTPQVKPGPRTGRCASTPARSAGSAPRRWRWAGRNQSLFLIGALARRPGQRGGAAAGRRAAARLGGRARLDRAGPDVAEPGRRHRRDLRRGVPAVQPGAGQPDRRLLLVGLGPDLRPDRDPVGFGAAPLVPARGPGDRRWRSRSWSLFTARQPAAASGGSPASPSRSPSASAVLAFLSALIPVFAGTVDWHQATSFHLDHAVRRLVRRAHQRDGRPVPDRLRRAGVRGRRLPRRRDQRPGPQRPARDVRQRRAWRRSTSSSCPSSGSA